MQSSGGLASLEQAAEHAVAGRCSAVPRAAPSGAAWVAHAADAPDNAVASTWAARRATSRVVLGGEVREASGREIGGRPVALPMVDIHTVGAGGGSIAWRDAGGALSVGPRSAGADPGPAGYGHGGEEPTVTDANLLLGLLGGSDRRRDRARPRGGGAGRRSWAPRCTSTGGNRGRDHPGRQRRDGPRRCA